MFQGYIARLVAWCDFIIQRKKVSQFLSFSCLGDGTGTHRPWNNGTVML